jgi:SAM-dependent methyltransferase
VSAQPNRQLFDHVASTYDAYRPDYPSQLFDALESAMGQPLLRARVLDVGAGTGIATRALAGRGADVVAVDPGPVVLGVLRSRSTSRVLPVVADGNALPLRDGAFDLVTFGQSFHWTDPARSGPGAARVLHDRGVLALFWNQMLVGEAAWWQRFVAESERLSPLAHGKHDDIDWGAEVERPRLFRWVRKVEIPWVRQLPVNDLVHDYSSHSYVAALAPGDRAALLDGLRSGLRSAYPDGTARLPYSTVAWVARR